MTNPAIENRLKTLRAQYQELKAPYARASHHDVPTKVQTQLIDIRDEMESLEAQRGQVVQCRDCDGAGFFGDYNDQTGETEKVPCAFCAGAGSLAMDTADASEYQFMA